MTDRKTPQQKKADAYAKERRYGAWKSDKADRRKRPLAKAMEHRAVRRRSHELRRWLDGVPEGELCSGSLPLAEP